MQRLFAAVRGACLPGLWSKGVRLAREQGVLLASRQAGELVLRVREAGRAVAPSVVLYPDEDEWSCDCGGQNDPCQHVAAAVIAVQQGLGRAPGEPEANERPGPRLEYRFSVESGWLRLERLVIAADGAATPLDESLTRLAATGRIPRGLAPTADDIAVDRIVSAMLRGDALESRIGALVRALTSARVSFEGRPVRVRDAPALPRVSVTDAGAAVVLTVVRPSGVTLVARGVALDGDELCPAGETELCGPRWERLPLERSFELGALGELVTRVLPELERRLPVDVQSQRLPRRTRGAPPRVSFEVELEDGQLSVLPTLVYGDPPEARVDAGSLVLLGRAAPERDEGRERALVAELRDSLNLVPGKRVSVGGRDADRLIARIGDWARQHGEHASRRYVGETPLSAELELAGDRFELSFQARAADTARGAAPPVRRASAEAVIAAWRDGLSVVPLEGGGWAPLPSDWLARFGDRVADLLALRREDGSVRPAGLPALAELCAELDAPPPPGLARLRPLLEGFEALPDAPLPVDLRATLRPYQKSGVNWLAFLRDAGLGGVLADDMGLGKTLQAICVLERPALVVAPKSVIFNWAEEIAKFRPGLRVSAYHGPGRELTDADVTLTTYALLRLDVDALAAREWATLVLDEAQAIKNPESQVARSAYRLKARQRLSLSGTPVENRLDELWSQMHFTNPGVLGGRKDFDARYAEPIARGDAGALASFRSKLKPFVLRRLKRDVAPELPLRTDTVLYVELEPEERAAYDAVRAATRREVVEQLAQGRGVLAALEALLRLRQAACHRGLLPGQMAEGSSKLERLLLALDDAASDGHKALVFSQWTSLLDLVEPALRRAGIPYLRLDGSTRDRASVVNGFQDPAGPPVLLISLKAGGIGLNLTAADHVFLLDPWWNPAVEDQAADRAHRIGQDRPVLVYRVVARDTVEEGILRLQERKRVLAAGALGTGDAALGITREELLALLD